MDKKYYPDTSIWLDFFEERDEPNFPKGEWAHRLIAQIIEEDDKIIYSDHIILELEGVDYTLQEIEDMLFPLKQILIFVESTEKQLKKAKDLSAKRKIPKGDALHALIARDNKAIMVTLDRHFQSLRDITEPKRPKDLIS